MEFMETFSNFLQTPFELLIPNQPGANDIVVAITAHQYKRSR